MAIEYKLSYTAAEIDDKLGKVDSLVQTVNGIAPDESGNVEIPGGGGAGGFGLSILDNYEMELITGVYNIDQENLPKRIDITQKDDGTPFEYDGVIIWTDAKDCVSYTTVTFNNSNHLRVGMSHGRHDGMNFYITDGKCMYIHATQYPQLLLKQTPADINYTLYPVATMQYVPTKFTSVSLGAYFELSAIKFYKVWGLKKK